jgi:peptidoglycan/LPS O-acetylase OafA/YrhL
MVKNRNFGLDVIRSVAILLVLIAHAGFSNFYGIKLGGLGVEIFFVLSGFLIGQILIKDFSKSVSKKVVFNFWIRRWYRTLPLYYTVVILRFIFFDSSLGWKVIVYFFFLQNNFVGIDFMPVSWSLVIEEWFYLVIPIMVYVIFNKGLNKNKFTIFLILFIILENVIRLLWVYYMDRGYAGIVGNFPFRLDSLMVGVLLAQIKLNYNSIYLKLKNRYVYLIALASWIVLLAIIGNINQTDGLKDQLIWTRTIRFCIISITIAIQIPFIEDLKINAKNILCKAVTLISLSTYAMYLIHPYIYSCVIGSKHVGSEWFWQMPLALFLVFISGYIIYRFYEKPITDLRERI